MIQNVKPQRRLSIITDILIFILLAISAFLILNIFKEIFIESDIQVENLALVTGPKDEMEIENAELVDKIQKEYNVNVKYGELQFQVASRMNANVQTNNIIINNNINEIYEALGQYGKDLFAKFKKDGYKLNIVIFKSFNDDNLALASKNNLNEINLYISNVPNFKRAFHHEMLHILEYYMSDKGVKFQYWNSFNPKTFKYTNDTTSLDSAYIYYQNLNSNEIDEKYFLSKYSKVNEKEDRAEIFATIMSTDGKLDYIENTDSPLYKKAKYLFSTIKDNIDQIGLQYYYNVDF